MGRAQTTQKEASKATVAPATGQVADWPTRIPTEVPEDALRFCRALSSVLRSDGFRPVDLDSLLSPAQSPAPAAAAETAPVLSVVVPIYNEADNLPVLYERVCRALEKAAVSFELVFVNDGSSDSSPSLLQHFARSDHRVLAIDLARNFGHQVAISAGLDHSSGRAVVVMDADLQDPPELLPEFIARWRGGDDVVYAVRAKRREGLAKRVAYSSFYRILKQVADIEIPLDAGDFCIMDRRVVDLLNEMPERNRFVRGIRSWVGFKQTSLTYDRPARNAGSSKYSLGRLMVLALDGLVSFSYLPLRVITALGFVASGFALLLAAFYAVKKLTVGLNPPGFATLVVAIFLLAGIQMITLGVIGEYVGRIFEEVKQRPLYVVQRVTRHDSR